MNRPTAVLISDVHFNIQTLEVADKALRMAVSKANELDVPLIIAGDLHDTKANIRGECINAIIETLDMCRVETYVLIGNHDKINEKSEDHSLNFVSGLGEIEDEDKSNWDNYIIKGAVTVVNKPRFINTVRFNGTSIELIPYQADAAQLRSYLSKLDQGCLIIMHQGIIGSEGGHYIQDKSALGKNDLAGLRVISGHYHIRQSFELPEGGRFDYIGNPYTLGFGEASHPEKGFQVLYDDGSLEFVSTNLRRHITLDCRFQLDGTFCYAPTSHLRLGDIVWVKCSGPTDVLCDHNKGTISKLLNLWSDFRLDFIPIDTKSSTQDTTHNITQDKLLDNIIDSLMNTDDNRKVRLKELWKQFI